ENERFSDENSSGDGTSEIRSNTRWLESARSRSSTTGDPILLTWSIVPDGTDISSNNNADSNFVEWMDSLYGGAGVADFQSKPWFDLVQRSFDTWSDSTGLQIVYEPNDDGALHSAGVNPGVDGVRGDIRVAGSRIDGNGGILAFAFFPNGGGQRGSDGDIVFDTFDAAYGGPGQDPNAENRFFVNVASHELGHSIGLNHTEPVDGTKLLEPFVNLAFFGPQEDDLYDANAFYGDTYETVRTDTTHGNDNIADAFDLPLAGGLASLTGASLTNETDIDFYRFTATEDSLVSTTLTPTGTAYTIHPQGEPNNATDVNRGIVQNVSFRILDVNGSVIYERDENDVGEGESLVDAFLPAGEYYLVVDGVDATTLDNEETQIYDVAMRLEGLGGLGDGLNLTLASVSPSESENFNLSGLNTLNTSPNELTLRFTGAPLDRDVIGDAIRIVGAGEDGEFGDPLDPNDTLSNDNILVEPGFLGLGDSPNNVIVRFADRLGDGLYRVEIYGQSVTQLGTQALINVNDEVIVLSDPAAAFQ
ncbi:MAG: matrixin family metalloprotease, partial [Planctomycetota bacterium]